MMGDIGPMIFVYTVEALLHNARQVKISHAWKIMSIARTKVPKGKNKHQLHSPVFLDHLRL